MPNIIFYGTKRGSIYCYDFAAKSIKGRWDVPRTERLNPESAQIKAVVHNPGENVFLALKKDNGTFYLYNTGENLHKMEFEGPPGGAHKLCWIDSVSGDFLVCSKKAGVLRVYNAAIPTCKEIIKVSRYGIYDIKRVSDEVFLLRLQNGQVTLFNIKMKKSLYTTEVGHTHQI